MKAYQTELLGDAPRATETSRAAYDSIVDRLSSKETVVYRTILREYRKPQYSESRENVAEFRPPPRGVAPGMTNREIAQAMGVLEHTMTGRTGALRDKGLLIPGVKKTRRFDVWNEEKQRFEERTSTAQAWVPVPIEGKMEEIKR